MTDLLTENARLRAALEAAKRDTALALAQVDRLLTLTTTLATERDDSREYAVALEAELKARAALATPAPDAVQEATRADRLADAAKTLLSVDGYGNRKEVYAACEGRVKVYKFDAALTRLSHARAPSQENAHDDA